MLAAGGAGGGGECDGREERVEQGEGRVARGEPAAGVADAGREEVFGGMHCA